MKATAIAAAAFLCCAAVLPAQDDAKLKEAVEAARKAYAAERYEEADRALAAVAEAAAANFEAMFLRAQVVYALGEWGKAITFSDNALKLDAKSVEAWTLLGNAAYAAGEAAKTDGRSSSARVTGFYQNSADAFGKASELKPDDGTLFEYRGLALFWVGEDKLDQSAAALEKAVQLRADVADPYYGLARTLFAKAESEKKIANDTKSGERSAAADEFRQKAVATAAKGLTVKELVPAVADDLAKLVYNDAKAQSRPEVAYEAFKAWIAAHPKSSSAHVWAGFVKAEAKEEAEATAHFTQAWEVSGKKNEVAAYELGRAAQRAGQPEKAAEWFGLAHDLRPDGWGEWSPIIMIADAANTYVERRDFAKGIALAEKFGLPRGEKSWQLHGNLGLWYRDWADTIGGRRGGGNSSEAKPKNESALKHYQKAVDLVLKDENAPASKKAQLVNDLGVIHHYQLGNMEKGLKEYRRALEIDPESIDPIENLGLCLNQLGKYEEAAALFKKALKQQPGRMVSRRGLNEAEKHLKK